jgi:hypothetical protein
MQQFPPLEQRCGNSLFGTVVRADMTRTQTPCHDRARLGVENMTHMTLANIIELAVAVAVIVVAIRFFVNRG